jgi:hypothetical protein
MLNNSQPVKPIGEKNRKLSRWRSLAYLMIGICIVVIYLAWRINAYLEFDDFGSQSYEMGLGASAKKYVVGDLGGMKVRIPRYYAELVEYADDPGFGEARKVPRPKRTLDSRLRSFGMDVHFPDMKGLVDAQARKEKRRQPLRERTWLYVGVSADKSYYGDGSLDRLSRVVLKPDEYPGEYWWNNYVRLADEKYGLEVYVVEGVDPKTGKPARESSLTDDIYLQRQATGKVETHIVCRRTSVPEGVASCNMKFTLEPKAHAGINVRFRSGLLREWKKIKVSVRDLLQSFKIKNSTATKVLEFGNK